MAESMDYESELSKCLSKLDLLQDTKVEKHGICAETEGSAKKLKADPDKDKEDEVGFMFPKSNIREKVRVDLKRVNEKSSDTAQQVNKYETGLENISASHVEILTLSEEPGSEQLRKIQNLSTSTPEPSSSQDWASLSKISGCQEQRKMMYGPGTAALRSNINYCLISQVEKTIGRLKYFKERLRQQRCKMQAARKRKENICLDLASQIEKMSLSEESGTHQLRKMTANPNISLHFTSQIDKLISFKEHQLKKMQGNATSSPIPNISWHLQTRNESPHRFFRFRQPYDERMKKLRIVSRTEKPNTIWDLASQTEKVDTNLKAGSQEQTMMDDHVTSIEKPSTSHGG